MENFGLPRASPIINEDLDDGDFVDYNVEVQVDLVDEEVDTRVAQERLAGVLVKMSDKIYRLVSHEDDDFNVNRYVPNR